MVQKYFDCQLNSSYFLELRLALSIVLQPVISIPAMEAEVKVDKTPENRADTATRETSPALPGAICDKMPI